MPDLLDLVNDEEPQHPEFLEPVRLGTKPTFVLIFTRDVETTQLHFVEGPPIHGYVPCPGEGCPTCYLGDSPANTHLLPVLNIARRAVEILRISDRRGPGSLLSGLLPHLAGDDTARKLFAVARDGTRFTVTVQPLSEHANRCPGVIRGFLEARKAGVSLLSAFPEYSAAELAEVESIRTVLEAKGGWTPPPTDAKDDGNNGGE